MAKIWRDEFGDGRCMQCWAEAMYDPNTPDILNRCENGHRITGEDAESPYYQSEEGDAE